MPFRSSYDNRPYQDGQMRASGALQGCDCNQCEMMERGFHAAREKEEKNALERRYAEELDNNPSGFAVWVREIDRRNRAPAE